MRMHAEKKNNFFFLLAQISTYCHQHRVHERFTSILGRIEGGVLLGKEDEGWAKGDTHMG